MKSIILRFLVLFLVLGCKDKAAEAVASVVTEESVADTDAVASAPSEPSASMVVASANNSSDKIIESKIIKNGNLRFETSDLDATYKQLQESVKRYNATIQNDKEGREYASVFRNITVRVPSKNFDSFIAAVSNGVNYFDTKEISSDDVTEEFIDVDSRVKTKKALEARYLELLKRANKITEMLEIEKQISEIREEIESKEGRLKYIQNRVDMSTVTIEFYKTIAEESGATVSYGTKIWNAIKSGFNSISNFIIWMIEVWPFLIIIVTLIYFIRKRLKKNKNA